MTRWIHPPERGLSLAIWKRVCADATDRAGRRDEEQAQQRFHELAARLATRNERLRPDAGRLTRVGVEIDENSLGALSIDVFRPRTPGRETLVTTEARRYGAHNGDRTIAHLLSGGIVNLPVPGRRTLVDHKASPRLGFDDYRVLGLKEVLRRLGTNHPLRQETIATAANADRSIAGRATSWETLVNERAKAGTANYVKKERAFFRHFETPLAALSAKYSKSQTKYWLKNTSFKVVDVIVSVADTDMPADQLYAYAMREGLVDYIRDEAGVKANADPTTTQLAGVSTTKSISGFSYLGTDDFFTELTASAEPLTKYLPPGFDPKEATKDPHTNEHGRTVQSAIFPNLKMGLQALSATMKRRRALFRADVSKYGYANPTNDELMYWTYVYYNSGEFNGELKKHKGKRVLNDWIKAGEFSDSIKVLQSWQMIKEMKIF